jgi:hypothetical protein
MQNNVEVVQGEDGLWYVYQGTYCHRHGTKSRKQAESYASEQRNAQYRLVRVGNTVEAQFLNCAPGRAARWSGCLLPTPRGPGDAKWDGPHALASGKAYFAKWCIESYETVLDAPQQTSTDGICVQTPAPQGQIQQMTLL